MAFAYTENTTIEPERSTKTQDVTQVFSFSWSYILPVIFTLFYLLRKTPQKVPRIGKSRWWSLIPGQVPMRFAVDKYSEYGYRKIHKVLGKPFAMKFFGLDYLLMPPKYLEDVRKSDEDNLSFSRSFSDAFNLHVSVGDLYSSTAMADVVKQNLNPQLPSLAEEIAPECDYVFSEEIGPTNEWKSFKAFQTFTRTAHRVTCRILLGDKLAHNPGFIEASLNFNRSLFMSAIIPNGVALGPLRSFVAWFSAVGHRRDLSRCIDLLVPEIQKRRVQASQASKHNDAIQWMIDLAGDDPVESQPRRIAQQLMHLLFAGSSAPGGLVVQMVYQILMSPEYLNPLREEIATTLKDTRGFTSSLVARTPLLESFMRETMRLYPTGVVSVTRTIVKESFQFHDGMTLPVNSRFAFPILAIHRDPDNYEDPTRFQGFRFYNPSNARSETNASTIDKKFLTFGYGRHACPGRFYAVRIAKLIFAKILHEFDLRWAGVVTSRPPNACIEGQNGPSPDQMVELKKRDTEG